MPEDTSQLESSATPPSLWRCFLGAIIAGGIAYLIYQLMLSIAASFAASPVTSDSLAVRRISSAVRTLVVGMAALGTGVFGLAAVGLFGLGVQVLVGKFKSP
jgi:hypothetical protein